MTDIQHSASGWTLAVSISESPDLDALGLFADDDKRLLSTILTALVYRGARIAYGGRIEPRSGTNFTQEIALQLAEAYRQVGPESESRPCIHYLRDNDARGEGPEGPKKLLEHALRLGAYSEIKLLRRDRTVATLVPSGKIVEVQVDGVSVGAKTTPEQLTRVPAIAEIFAGPTGGDELADMRAAMARETSGRIILGGRVTGVTKGIPGIAAEALATLKAGKPLLVVGAVGGASRDVAWKLGLIADSERVQRDDSVYRDSDDTPSKDRYWKYIDQLGDYAAAYKSSLDAHGLFDDARRLAVSENYAEIGSLVLKMLGKLLPASDGA
jgi:hypothetical protein